MGTKILGLCGSYRKGSHNKKLLAIAGQTLIEKGVNFQSLDLKTLNLPIIDEDLKEEKGLPMGAEKLIHDINSSRALLIATPEYNGSIPGSLKNAIDWASLAPQNPFKGKIVALIGTSTGWWGASKSLIHTRHIFSHLGAIVIPAQLALPQGHENILDQGLAQESHKKQLNTVCDELVRFAQSSL